MAVLAVRGLTGGTVLPQTRSGSVSVYGQNMSVPGTLNGNLTAQNHATVTVTGHVTGWLHAYGSSSVVLGPGARVDGGVLESTGTLSVEPGARVGNGLDTYNLSDPAALDGEVAGQVRTSASGLTVGRRGHVAGDLSVWASAGQRVEVDGAVDGSVRVSGTDLHLGPAAHIGGSTVVYSGTVTRS